VPKNSAQPNPRIHRTKERPTKAEQVDRAARETANRHPAAPRIGGAFDVQQHVARLERVLNAAHKRFVSEPELSLTAEGEWFLDNFHVVQQALRQVRTDLPPRFYRQLPTIELPSGDRCPRIGAIAGELIRVSEDYLDLEQVNRFVRTYQSVAPLTMGELWALPAMLRLGVLEVMARAAGELTNLDRPAGGREPAMLVAPRGPLAEDLRISNGVLTLRGLAVQDWNDFFESVSEVDRILRKDPAGVFARMDFQTRDRYRKVVEQLAKGVQQEEHETARAVVGLAEQAGKDEPRRRHVGYYLLDVGRAQLEESIGYGPSSLERLRRGLLRRPTPLYLGAILLLTALFTAGVVACARAFGGSLLELLLAFVVGVLPVSAVAVHLVNWTVTHALTPRRLPAMDYEEGIPDESRTIVLMPCMLTDAEEVASLLRRLERHHLGNPDPNLSFALLSDLADAPRQVMPGDDELIQRATEGVRHLNRRYGADAGPSFYLFHRERQWNPAEGYWMGWERKRGKLADIDRLLLGEREEIHFLVQEGDLDRLQGIRYAITVDRDTIIPLQSANLLIGTLAHPLNQAQFAPDSDEVIAGYTVLQPRLEVWPPSASKSLFTRLYAGDTVVDLYTTAVSDAYQDLFGEGIYAGKGIYDIGAFERSLQGRVPQNALLSHDLFEGVHGRVGLCTTVTFYEDFPTEYLPYVYRMHRWVRGDWQLLPWLMPQVPSSRGERLPKSLSLLDRWKILDNLRRSLVGPSLLAFLLAGWVALPGSAAVWTGLALLISFWPFLVQVVTDFLTSGWDILRSMRNGSLARKVGRWLLGLAFLAYETLVVVDAVGSTLVRLFVTRRHLLQWTTSAHTVHILNRERKVRLMWLRMGSALIVAVVAGAVLVLWAPDALPAAAPFLASWLLSPWLALRISQPDEHKLQPLAAAQRRELRHLARRTWRYFERFVGPDDHWLAPDHFQEDPLGQHARRTSATNIGLQLLSTLAACDLGHLGAADMAFRLRFTFEHLAQMERHRGHFLNWYDTRDLRPLQPRYVSTVDSGNLAACFLTLRTACLELPEQHVLGRSTLEAVVDHLGLVTKALDRVVNNEVEDDLQALRASLDRMQEKVLTSPEDPRKWHELLTDLLKDDWPRFIHDLGQFLSEGKAGLSMQKVRELRVWSEAAGHHLNNSVRDLDDLLPWLNAFGNTPELLARSVGSVPWRGPWEALDEALPSDPTFGKLSRLYQRGQEVLQDLIGALNNEQGSQGGIDDALDWCDRLWRDLDLAAQRAAEMLHVFEHLAQDCERYVHEMDFGFLYNPRRSVLHIGYNVTSAQMDKNCYDLLASEARLASLIAIAKGEVPKSHWMHLSRAFTRANGSRALLSWSGTMFEYLMPNLFLRSYPGSLLQCTNEAVVERQIAYGGERGVPWGISESGYYRFDAAMAYQYKAFGVPGLGLKRGLGEDLVITPYASILALSLRPSATLDNLDALERIGLMGHYGFYESIDYTSKRMPLAQESAIVRSYMAHHQGMVMLSLVNYLLDQVMVKRLHADSRIEAVDLLLHEQMPADASAGQVHPQETRVQRPSTPVATESPYSSHAQGPAPDVFLLSNGTFSTIITSAGAGYSQWRDLDLTRWRSDATCEDWGHWVYVQDRRSDALWSAGFQPTRAQPDWSEVLCYGYKAEYRRKDHGISLRMEVAVAPGDDVELRRLTLTNDTNHRRRLWLCSYAEVALARHLSDVRHPAFSKLFVESEFFSDLNALAFRRRTRGEDEQPAYLMHMLVARGWLKETGAYETDRARFLGRGRSAANSHALQRRLKGLEGHVGATLDPVLSIGQSVDLLPHTSAQACYVTLAAASRDEALHLARRYRSWLAIRRAFGQARDAQRQELRQLALGTEELKNTQTLLSALLYPQRILRADANTLLANELGQSGLWPFGISGDYPILLVRTESRDDAELLHQVLRAHAYWRRRQVKIDLVILNERSSGYADEFQGYLQRLVNRTGGEAWLNRRGGIFVLRAEQLSRESRVLLEAAARAVLGPGGGSLTEQVRPLAQDTARLPAYVPSLSPDEAERLDEGTPELARPDDLTFDNGLGGFSPDGREYWVFLRPGEHTPAPWINVIANQQFGCLVSESGGGYTWAKNSGENRLTPWANDAVTDRPGEVLYLRDEETAAVWSPTPQPCGDSTPYLVKHGAGYTEFEHHSHGLEQELRLFVDRDDPVKIMQLRLANTWQRVRRITATCYVEWVLGTDRQETGQYVLPECDTERHALLARNPYSAAFSEAVAFLCASEPLHGLTTDRADFLGRYGSVAQPAALQRIGLSGRVEPGLDPCAAVQVHLELAPGDVKEIYFVLGQGLDREQAIALVDKYLAKDSVESSWEGARARWDGLLGKVQVRTPEPSLDLMLNQWLLYQTLSCRLWARSALYQSSGAYGFRDQLQDVMALVHVAPELTREHILRSAAHQFEEGDVLHWWHPPLGRGVRTRCSDDLLWLPFVTAYYVRQTGDRALLDEEAPFRRGEPLKDGESERYGQYETTEEAFSVFEHCCRAIDRGATQGPHGLPLMGSGDWNDGMNRVGIGGQGESVWLAWFLCATLENIAALCDDRGESKRADEFRARAVAYREALAKHAWDGNWYLRAFFDDGTPLGSEQNSECQIDSIAQSWAVLAGPDDEGRARQAMASVDQQLVERERRLLLLFRPPFDHMDPHPGYIRGYPPGIRENGGQYTHAALWVAWASAALGQGDLSEELFRLLNPILQAQSAEAVRRYRVEPYVVAADVYSNAQHVGRGGWTWYTGSSGWMYRLGLEALLGLVREGQRLLIDPCIPCRWKGYEIDYRFGQSTYHIDVDNPNGVNRGVARVEVDGEVMQDLAIPLADDGQPHHVRVTLV